MNFLGGGKKKFKGLATKKCEEREATNNDTLASNNVCQNVRGMKNTKTSIIEASRQQANLLHDLQHTIIKIPVCRQAREQQQSGSL